MLRFFRALYSISFSVEKVKYNLGERFDLEFGFGLLLLLLRERQRKRTKIVDWYAGFFCCSCLETGYVPYVLRPLLSFHFALSIPPLVFFPCSDEESLGKCVLHVESCAENKETCYVLGFLSMLLSCYWYESERIHSDYKIQIHTCIHTCCTNGGDGDGKGKNKGKYNHHQQRRFLFRHHRPREWESYTILYVSSIQLNWCHSFFSLSLFSVVVMFRVVCGYILEKKRVNEHGTITFPKIGFLSFYFLLLLPSEIMSFHVVEMFPIMTFWNASIFMEDYSALWRDTIEKA